MVTFSTSMINKTVRLPTNLFFTIHKVHKHDFVFLFTVDLNDFVLFSSYYYITLYLLDATTIHFVAVKKGSNLNSADMGKTVESITTMLTHD